MRFLPIQPTPGAALLLVIAAVFAQGQQTQLPTPAEQETPAVSQPEVKQTLPTQTTPAPTVPAAHMPGAAPTAPMIAVKQPSEGDRRRAVKLFLAATKLYEKEQFEAALEQYRQASTLDPANTQYAVAAEVARGHAVTALIQAAARARTQGDSAAARAALARALVLDPSNPQVHEHLRELGDDALLGQQQGLYDQTGARIGVAESLAPAADRRSFHLRTSQRQIIQQVFKAYGLDVTIDDSVRPGVARLDVDDVSFAEAARVVGALTQSFYVPIDSHRALVARDTRENRQQYMRNGVETVYLSGLTSAEMTDMGTLARNVFEVQQTSVDPSAGTMTLRAPENRLDAFNATFRDLMDGRSQVLLEVRLVQLAHTSERNTGVTPPQTVTAFNVYAEEQSILNANQSLVQQIVSSGLAAPGDTLAILGILLASGQVSSSLFSNGIALFGGGLTQSALSPAPATLNLSLNSSDSRELDQYQLRLEDGEEGTLRSGERYPIMTSNFSSLGANSLSIPGLTSAGTSSSLSSILSSLQGASTSLPQIEYQDLGLTLKARPRVLRSGDVALTMDMKITALAGSSINGVPVLANRAYSGVVTLRQGEGVVVASEMDSQESRALSGIPGLTEVPGLDNITDKDVQKNYSTLLIIVTPHVVRSPQMAGHTAMVRIERGAQSR